MWDSALDFSFEKSAGSFFRFFRKISLQFSLALSSLYLHSLALLSCLSLLFFAASFFTKFSSLLASAFLAFCLRISIQSLRVKRVPRAAVEGSNPDRSCIVECDMFFVGAHSSIMPAALFACCTKDDKASHALDGLII